MAAATLRSSSTGSDNTFTVSSISASLPAGSVTGDGDLITFFTLAVAPTAAPAHTTPAGYTLLCTTGSLTFDSTYNCRLSRFGRIAPGSPGAVTLQAAANCVLSYVREAWQGVASGTAFANGAASSAVIVDPSSSGTGIIPTSFNTSAADSVHNIAMWNVTGGTFTATATGGANTYTGFFTGAGVEHWSKAITSSGTATGGPRFDQSDTGDAVWLEVEILAATGGSTATATPGVGSVTVAGLAPSIVPKERTVAPGVGAVTLAGLTPTETREKAIAPGLASLSVGGLSPNETDERGNVGPGVGATTLQGLAPTLTKETVLQPGVGSAVVGGLQPTVQLPGQVFATATPDFVPIVVYGYAPTLDTGADASANRGHVGTGRRWHGRSSPTDYSFTESLAVSAVFPTEAPPLATKVPPLGGYATLKPLEPIKIGAEPAKITLPQPRPNKTRRSAAKRRREEELLLSRILN